MGLTSNDRAKLETAVWNLECISIFIELANLVGSPIDKLLSKLPVRAHEVINKAVRKALDECLWIAVKTLGEKETKPSKMLHRLGSAASGAAGGALGLYGLPLELPVSTIIMLRAIAAIARSEGEDLRSTEVQLSCITVFALGGGRSHQAATGAESAETGYYAIRAALAEGLRDAAAHIGTKGLTRDSGPPIIRFLAKMAARFGITVSDKAAAQAVPVIGAVGGASINVVFINHFLRIAHGHFTIRRLERVYGETPIREEYEEILRNLRC